MHHMFNFIVNFCFQVPENLFLNPPKAITELDETECSMFIKTLYREGYVFEKQLSFKDFSNSQNFNGVNQTNKNKNNKTKTNTNKTNKNKNNKTNTNKNNKNNENNRKSFDAIFLKGKQTKNCLTKREIECIKAALEGIEDSVIIASVSSDYKYQFEVPGIFNMYNLKYEMKAKTIYAVYHIGRLEKWCFFQLQLENTIAQTCLIPQEIKDLASEDKFDEHFQLGLSGERDGINNPGTSCFLIAVVQILAQIEPFLKALYQPSFKQDDQFINHLKLLFYYVHLPEKTFRQKKVVLQCVKYLTEYLNLSMKRHEDSAEVSLTFVYFL